ncbi:outer membrane protein transport protein [Candidatus Albibeggiatoa sp. nov. NOAA]|uniref:OmpP1/FadL family transporter n=1 Tax=Candidatus Albibeggiatoa sp. nov. NOAA TaxID=3162724 RepID=UPI0032FFCD21|nr:outer membrane protein transport protein [Thiotrichaceae bacterium]
MRKQLLIAVVASCLCFSQFSYATNGYWSLGYGPKSKAMGGACVAMALGAMCTASNPGSLVLVGNRVEVGLGLFAPSRSITANNDASPIGPPNGPASIPVGTYESENDYFLIPHFAFNYLVRPDLSIGVTFGANGGMNTEYPAPVFQNFGNPAAPSTLATSPTGVDLMQAFIGLPISYKINEQHSVGIAPLIAMQRFKAEGLQPFTPFSKHPEHVTNNGYDMSYGGGLRFGWFWQVNDRLNFGASYQTRLWMSEFDDYKGLFAEDGDFDVPPNYDIGFSYKITPKFTFAFNYQRIEFDKVNAVSNNSAIPFVPGQTLLGTEDGLGFGWDSINVYKFGLQWEYNHDWTFRAGYSYASTTFPSEQSLFNVLAPAVVKRHITGGFTRKLGENQEISLAACYVPNETMYGQNPNTGPQTGSIEMDQWEIEIGWSMRF